MPTCRSCGKKITKKELEAVSILATFAGADNKKTPSICPKCLQK